MSISKTFALSGLVLLTSALAGRSAALANANQKIWRQAATVSSRGPNTRIWSLANTNLAGNSDAFSSPRRVVEMASGMQYWDGTNWQASRPYFEATTNGFSATHTQHKVYLSPDLYTQGAVQVVTRDGLVMNSSPEGIGLFDTATGNFLLIGQITNTVGVQVAPNQVVYPDAFSGLCAEVLYTVEKGAFHQDVVFTGSVNPADYGFPTNTTRLQVITEFYNPPTPQVRTNSHMVGLPDQTLGFGEFVLRHGRAYLSGATNQAGVKLGHSAPVGKQFVQMNGRYFLLESVDYSKVQTELQALPNCTSGASASNGKLQKRISEYAAMPLLPNHDKLAKSRQRSKPALAAARVENGFVLDYIASVGGTLDDNSVFYGDTTYFISGPVYAGGDVVMESGAVLKFAAPYFDGSILQPGGSINLDPSVFNPPKVSSRPAVLTAEDDESVGESVAGVDTNWTGVPMGAVYGGGGYSFGGGYLVGMRSFVNMRFCYAQTAIDGDYVDGGGCENVQFVNCSTALMIENGDVTPFEFVNCLLANVGSPVVIYNSATPGIFDNCTFDQCGQIQSGSGYFYFNGSGSLSNYCATNCIFSNVGDDWTQYPISGDHNAFYNNYNNQTFGSNPILLAASPYQPAGAGNYYLAPGTLQGLGTTNIYTWLLADLRQKTTASPVVFADQVISNDLALAPQAARDTNAGAVDVGYHYDPIDFAMGGVTISNATLLLTNGAVLACFDDSGAGYGLNAGTGGQFVSVGDPVSLNSILCFNNIQEEVGTTNWTSPGQALLVPNTATNGPGSPIYCRFTDFSAVGSHVAFVSSTAGNSQPLAFQDTQFHNGQICTSNVTFNFTNCLFERVHTVLQSVDGNPLQFGNNLCWYGSLTLGSLPTNSVLQNNEFSGVLITNATPTSYIAGYNGFFGTSNTFLCQTNSHDWFASAELGFQPGPLGNFYQWTSSPLIHTGSTNAGALGLYHYCVTTNQAVDGTNIVSIGYHYIAVGTNGLPLSTSGDGIGDYLKDSNGDGIYNAGDLGDWKTNSTCGDGISDYLKYLQGRNLNICPVYPDTNGILYLQVYTPLK